MALGFWSHQLESFGPPAALGEGFTTPAVTTNDITIQVGSPGSPQNVGTPFNINFDYLGGVSGVTHVDVYRSNDSGTTFTTVPVQHHAVGGSPVSGSTTVPVTPVAPVDSDVVYRVLHVPTDPDIVAQWDFHEADGYSDAVDRINGHTWGGGVANLQHTTDTFDNSIKALQYIDEDDFFLEDIIAPNAAFNNAYSVQWLFKGALGSSIFFRLYGDSGTQGRFEIEKQTANNGTIRVLGYEPAFGGIDYTYAWHNIDTTYNDGSWHEATVAWDGALIKLYIDGVEIAPTSASGSDALVFGTLNLHLGGSGATHGYMSTYFGEFRDRLRVYSRAVTAQEALDSYNYTPVFDDTAVIDLQASLDSTPPDAVTDLAVTGSTTTTLTLGWTAPADQPENEAVQSYDIRYSLTPITNDSEFSAAASVTTLPGAPALPTPGAPGFAESYTTGTLTTDTTYYFAIKSTDEVALTSAINSNVPVSGKTDDAVAPAAVADLSVTGKTQTTMSFTFTAPHENQGGPGGATVASYEIRYSTSPITDDTSFNAATLWGSPPTPLTPGSAQPFTITGLTLNTTYYIALKSKDEVPNTSALSNIVTDTTLDVDSISVTAPNGGETVFVSFEGSTFNITWDATGFPAQSGATVEIRLARDGVTFNEQIVAAAPAPPEVYAWAPTGPLTKTAKIKVISSVGGINDESDAVFTIDVAALLHRLHTESTTH